MDKGAIFSENREYRFVLWRRWDERKPMITFIGINPSSADEFKDDETIRRVISFATTWGYGGVYMVNIYAYISTDYSKCKKIGSLKNIGFVEEYGKKSKTVVFAWGKKPIYDYTIRHLREWFPKAKCLYKNLDGSPVHPLFVKGDTKLKKFFK